MSEKQKLLIVDDSEFNRDILKEILGSSYDYLEAENGNQAIQILEVHPEDVCGKSGRISFKS